ncbi:MAG: DUF167 domain-containing protein [Dehalococcoidia bacterium]
MAEVHLAVRVTPRAGRDGIDGWRDGVLRVRLAAPPLDGRANDALTRLIAAALGVAPRAVRVVRGATSRHKLLAIDGVDEQGLRERLGGP